MNKKNNIKSLFFLSFFIVFSNSAINVKAEQNLSKFSTPNLDDITYPDDAPPSQTEVELGKILFFDTRLSSNNKISCATCHNPDFGFSDGKKVSFGVNGNKLSRNTPHLYNLAWNNSFFWDGRASTLEKQALMPVTSKNEMNLPKEELVEKISKVAFYQERFSTLYSDGINALNISKALASFERSIITRNSPFDKYLKGDKKAISKDSIAGMNLFTTKASCIVCHSGANFTDNSFHNLGFTSIDEGRGKIVNDKSLNGAFKTPGLRNIALSAPYLHDGSLKTLEDVVVFYNKGGGVSKNKSNLIRPLNLNKKEIYQLVSFLNSLTEEIKITKPIIP